jgi:energy-coupling factor transport system ATP-binding protein
MISISNLTFHYSQSKTAAIKGINLSISQGEFIGIIGPTGAGKSTLTLCLNGVIPHFQQGDYYGEVKVDGKDTIENDCVSLAYSIGSVFQDPETQIVTSVVEEEIAFGLENMNIDRKEISDRITESLEMTGISNLRNKSTSQLSGGQKQRVAIAAAIALRPKILVLDEPTSELDPQGSRETFDILRKLNSENDITIVIVEQKIHLLTEYCSRLLVMDKGSIILDGATRSIIARQDILQKLGVNCSPVTQLAFMLKQNGLYDGDFPIDVDEAFLMINELLSNCR